MNLVEHYIKEVHKVEEIEYEHGSFISVDLTTDCYGRIGRNKTSFSNLEEWNKIKEQGYYLA